MADRTINIALAQMALSLGEPEGNYQIVKQYLEQAVKKKADLLLLPELWASGYDLENCKEYASSIEDGYFKRMSSLALSSRITIGGSLIESDQGSFYNTFVLFGTDGELIAKYRKIHLFQPLGEERFFLPGDRLVIADTQWGKIGLTTCFDLRFPEIFRAYAIKGVEMFLLVAEWPLTRISHWHQLLKARSIENQCFVAAVNKVGTSKGVPLGGGSVVINPMGEELARGEHKEGLFQAVVDLDEVKKTREWMPILEKRKPDVYQ